MQQIISTDQRKVHTLTIDLGDTLADLNVADMDDVEIVFVSRANNRPTSPMKLTWANRQRLTRDA